MATPRPWTPAEDDALRELHAAGATIGQVADRMARSKSTISYHAKRLGLVWDRQGTRTAAATAAKVADAKARRAALQLALLDDAERLRAQLFAPTKAFNFGGKDNTYAETHLDRPVFADQLRIVQAVGIAVDRHLKIATHDADTGLDTAVGMLDQIATAITAAADKLGPQDHP